MPIVKATEFGVRCGLEKDFPVKAERKVLKFFDCFVEEYFCLHKKQAKLLGLHDFFIVANTDRHGLVRLDRRFVEEV